MNNEIIIKIKVVKLADVPYVAFGITIYRPSIYLGVNFHAEGRFLDAETWLEKARGTLASMVKETEDRIAAGRRFYNANVRNYNTRIESVPSNMIANTFKFEKATYFEVNDPEVRRDFL